MLKSNTVIVWSFSTFFVFVVTTTFAQEQISVRSLRRNTSPFGTDGLLVPPKRSEHEQEDLLLHPIKCPNHRCDLPELSGGVFRNEAQEGYYVCRLLHTSFEGDVREPQCASVTFETDECGCCDDKPCPPKCPCRCTVPGTLEVGVWIELDNSESEKICQAKSALLYFFDDPYIDVKCVEKCPPP